MFAISSVLYGCKGVWGPEQLETYIYLRAARGRGGSDCLISLSVSFDRVVQEQRCVKKVLRKGD